jgi:hypothetical protein
MVSILEILELIRCQKTKDRGDTRFFIDVWGIKKLGEVVASGGRS